MNEIFVHENIFQLWHCEYSNFCGGGERGNEQEPDYG